MEIEKALFDLSRSLTCGSSCFILPASTSLVDSL
jgi:hypothetical protein